MKLSRISLNGVWLPLEKPTSSIRIASRRRLRFLEYLADQTLGETVIPFSMNDGAVSLCLAMRRDNLALRSLKRKIFTVYRTNGGGILITHPTNEKEPHNMKFSSLDDVDYKASDSTSLVQGKGAR